MWCKVASLKNSAEWNKNWQNRVSNWFHLAVQVSFFAFALVCLDAAPKCFARWLNFCVWLWFGVSFCFFCYFFYGFDYGPNIPAKLRFRLSCGKNTSKNRFLQRCSGFVFHNNGYQLWKFWPLRCHSLHLKTPISLSQHAVLLSSEIFQT